MAGMPIDMFIEPDQDPRIEPPMAGSERDLLTGFLAWHRATLELKCSGLDAAALARRSADPSSLSLLGLVRHLAEVERSWFRRGMAGQDAAAAVLYGRGPGRGLRRGPGRPGRGGRSLAGVAGRGGLRRTVRG
jgi:Protein of unknown function (DUF664)